jgi:hypothetical protein
VRVRNWMIGLTLLLALALACHIAARAMIARAVLSPHATRFQTLIAALNPPYQMAAPHYSLRKEVSGFFTPTVVHAQITGCGGGTSPCAYLKQMTICPNPNCPGGGCYCPDCLNLSGDNCTPYHCVTSTKQSDTCDDSYTSCSGACQNVGACRQ